MGIVTGQSKIETIDIKQIIDKYSNKFTIKSYLRKDVFKTLLVTTKEKSEFGNNIPLVIKLFPKDSENYLKYSQEFEEIKNNYSNLKSTPNVVPIIKLDQIKEANAGMVIRQYIQYNLKQALYYLIRTSEVEKKWVCFQLLHGLNQIHSKLKCHGDIKPENILVNSKLCVFYSDISVYKPAYLLIENLQLYNNIFYCNSVDRACYLAPERFVHNLKGLDNSAITREMDIFSLGVVFAEIFLERQNLFTQNDLMNYKNKKIDLKEKLNDINDNTIRNVIQNMIELEPKKRMSLNYLINLFADKLCPAPITRFIANLNLMIIVYGYYKNDLLVALLYKHFIQIWKSLCINNKILEKIEIPKLKKKLNKYLVIHLLSRNYNIYNIKSEFPLAFVPNKNNPEIFIESEITMNFFINDNFNMKDFNISDNSKNDCTIIIIKYLISCLENLKFISTYFSIFEMVYNLSKILIKNKNSNVIIDLIIPNYLNLFNLNNTKLSIEAYNSILDILNLIDYEELILNQIDFNLFNYYIFEKIYDLFLQTDKLELKCAIISRLDEIIELENNFLLSYLNTYTRIIINEKNKDKKNNYYQDAIFQSYFNNKSIRESKDEKRNKKFKIDFNNIHQNYIEDLDSFKKKLKDIVKKIMEDTDNKNNDALKLIIIQKYREICLFCGNYNENQQLFNHLFILFNQNNHYIQKEIIKLFPSLILLFGSRLFYEYFCIFIESTCQKKNSELIIIEIIDALIILSKMNLIQHQDENKNCYKILNCYKLLIPYLVHPNYLLRNKLNYLLEKILDDQHTYSELYVSFNQNIKKILSENNEPIVVMNVVNKNLINKIIKYYSLPREIFLMYKYNLDCNYYNKYYFDKQNLLSDVTKIKIDHFINRIKSDEFMRNNLGLINKKDIFNIKLKLFLDKVKEGYYNKYKKEGKAKDKNNISIQKDFIKEISILFNDFKTNPNYEKENFMEIWYKTCFNSNIIYGKIIYLLKVLNYQLDIKNIATNNLLLPIDDNYAKQNELKDWNFLDDIESSNFQSINPMNYLIKEQKNPKYCYELNLDPSESIIKLIPVNCFFTNFYQNFFVSVTDEGIVRLHLIYNDKNIENIFTIKNRARYKIEIGDFIFKSNHISYVEKTNKIIIFVAISNKLEIITFELNDEHYDEKEKGLKDSCICNNIECESLKEIICIEDMVKSNKNFVVLGNKDNSISFYNYIDNNIDYINNCSYFSSSYGCISLIKSFLFSENILIATSHGFLILYDLNLRSFINVYSFSKRKMIKQIVEYIPKESSESILDLRKSEVNIKDNMFFILTDDDQITLWNLSIPNPMIIYSLVRVNKIEDYKKIKTSDITISKMEKMDISKQNYSSYSINNLFQDEQFVKININFIWDIKNSSVEIITGEKQGICRALNFSYENLKKIKNKQGHKNNKFSQIIFSDNIKVNTKNNSKYIKDKEVFVNKLIYSTNKDIDNKNINKEEYKFKEMNDIILLRDCITDSNIEFIVSGYSNGTIKLWII